MKRPCIKLTIPKRILSVSAIQSAVVEVPRAACAEDQWGQLTASLLTCVLAGSEFIVNILKEVDSRYG